MDLERMQIETAVRELLPGADPEEFAEFLWYVAVHAHAALVSLDVGIGAGWVLKLIRDYYETAETILLDASPAFRLERGAVVPLIQSRVVAEIDGAATEPAVWEALLPYEGRVGFVFLDGRYEAILDVVALVRRLARPRCWVCLHGTLVHPPLQELVARWEADPAMTLLARFTRKHGIDIWGLR